MKILMVIISLALLALTPVYTTAQDDHDRHDHGAEAPTHEDAAPTGDHDGHEDELVVELSAESARLAGIEISTAVTGHVDRTVDLPGEIGFNEDRLAHIAPRFAGVAQQARFRVGDYVSRGDTVAIVESNESMNNYSITAPISGWVLERHITPGEFVSEENSIYLIADLSTVWVNLAVYPKDAGQVKKGQSVKISAIGSENVTSGTIEYITPIVDLRTRSLTARITLSNPDNLWRPGSFVLGKIAAESGTKGLIIEKSAVQYLDEKSVIFLLDGPNRFRPEEVTTGDSNQTMVQLLTDIGEGTRYVSKGAFELKAKIVTSNLDAHAGHGH
ncbi:MAG: efflux RND transporter periplasmic adaptor subunit [bacterium]|nr:efflux RND transporter periplasmic adaptor subunit [bacterium]